MKQQDVEDPDLLSSQAYIDMYADTGESPDASLQASESPVFGIQGQGVQTRGDPVYSNASQAELRKNVRRAIQRENQQLLDAHHARLRQSSSQQAAMQFGALEIPASDALSASASRRLKLKIRKFYAGRVFLANYRPFSKSWVYDASVSMRISAQPSLPDVPEAANLAICFTNRSEKTGVAALMVSGVSDLDFFTRARLLPLHAYRAVTVPQTVERALKNADGDAHYVMTDGITDRALAHFCARYESASICKEDIFYYVYGVLHSEDCSARYLKDLRREPPQLPLVRCISDFAAFSDAGRALAHLHVNYDEVSEYPVHVHMKTCPEHINQADYWRVTQMKFGARGDRTKIIYNEWISLSGIPREAYDYVIHEKPALVWAMESQGIKTHANSGLSNDANRWATECMGDPAYPLKLLRRIITVSLETRRIVAALPFLE